MSVSDSRFGFWSALGAAVLTLATFAIAIATPPLSGPLCHGACFGYPYLAVAGRFPRDYVWMFVALPAILAYLAFMLALDAHAAPARRLFARFGLLLAEMATLALFADYFLQLAVLQPSVLAGESDGVSLLSQYNPHGVFIALEEMGYLLMSTSMASMALACAGTDRLQRAVRWIFVAGWAGCLAALAGFTLAYGHAREYRLEIALISGVWLTLIPSAFMMAVSFLRKARAVAGA